MKKVFIFFTMSMTLYLMLGLFVWLLCTFALPFREITCHPMMMLIGGLLSVIPTAYAVDEMK
jgi:hypothetical protein